MVSFRGSMVAVVTPMSADGAIDYPALDRLLEFHLNNGTNAIVAVGTTGESATLDHDEHCAVIAHCVTYLNGRLPVIAGTGSNSTKEAIELTQCAKSAGASAALLVTPYYNKPTQQGLYLHHKAVAEAVDLPQILYNVPGRTAVDMQTETVAKLSQVDNIIGIKDATGRLDRLPPLLASCAMGFEFYSGDDATAVNFILQGGHGGISVTANVAPKAVSSAYQQALAGNEAEALAIDAPLKTLHRDLFIEANPIPVKWVLEQMGLIGGGIRLPLTPLSDLYHERLETAMRHAGLLA
jgi:4-hydroxy-tetrahydrodipicolinate synthase